MKESIILIVIASMIIIVILVIFFSNKAIIKRKLKKSNYKRIADFKDGDIAKIVGCIEIVGKPLYSPLSKRECSHYYVHVEQEKSSGKSSSWETIIEEEVTSRYLIKDGIRYAIINDKKLKSYIVQDAKFSSGFWNDATENLENYLKSKGEESEGFFGFNKTLRFKEGVLEKGEEIAVLGKGNWKDATSLNLPEKYGKVLEITSTNEQAIYLSDDTCTTEKISKPNPSSDKRTITKKRYKK